MLLEKSAAIGGIWKFYANVYSRVNTSEVGYRICNQTGAIVRPNQDHSPRHDVLRDIYSICANHAYGKDRCGWEVKRLRSRRINHGYSKQRVFRRGSRSTRNPGCTASRRISKGKKASGVFFLSK